MNLLIVPFHDWRKILKEGFRTRDAHFIETLEQHNGVNQIIVNRPTTLLEIFLKKKNNLIKGEVIYAQRGFKLYQIRPKLYVVDYISTDILGQVLKGHNWFIDQYSNPKYLTFIRECLKKLEINDNYYLINQNIFASKLSKRLAPIKSIFDAWDDFTKFKVYEALKDKISQAYVEYATLSDFWITNSNDNVKFFTNTFNPKNIFLIKNGVDVHRFLEQSTPSIPDDIKDIPRPIIGFGGKITHLIDVKLLNHTMKITPSVSFVFVGQILDRHIFNSIDKLDNFYYLGDKHYDEYPNYVQNFDVCIVPYVVANEKKSGANSIKAYEYLATKKKVVGTNSNGLEDLSDYLHIVSTAEEFSEEICNLHNTKSPIALNEHSWDSKVNELLKLIKNV